LVAKINSISKEEAKVRLQEILTNNKEVFEASSYKLEAEQNSGGKPTSKSQNDAGYLQKLKNGVKK
jgi:hypothetical protein